MDETSRSKVLASNNRWRARVYGNGGVFTPSEWQALCAAFGNACACCGAVTVLTVDHIVPISCGGLNTIDNIQPLCAECNGAKRTQAIDYRSGVPVLVEFEPAEVENAPLRQRLDLDEDERRMVRQAAALAGDRSVAAFCRRVVLEAAERVVRSAVRSEGPKRTEEGREGRRTAEE
jgi:5-methylcytosine-specific restriction endonuclease McrA